MLLCRRQVPQALLDLAIINAEELISSGGHVNIVRLSLGPLFIKKRTQRTVKTLLPEAGTLERAVTYRNKKIKPLFLQLKNKVAAMAAQVKEFTKELENWKGKYQKLKQKYNGIQKELDDIRIDNQKLSEEKNIM